MIELKDYSLVELRQALKIPLRQWERSRDRLLEYFKEFFDYEYIFAGHKYTFTIKQQYKEYVPIPRRNQAKEKPMGERSRRSINQNTLYFKRCAFARFSTKNQ